MSTLTQTRIDAHILKIQTALAEKLASGALTEAKVEEFNKTLDIDMSEFMKFQDLKSRAMLSGKLSYDEAMQIYNYLGEGGPSKFNKLDLAVKVSLTALFSELLAMSVRGAL